MKQRIIVAAIALPLLVDSLVLVDGDAFEGKNSIRQDSDHGFKLDSAVDKARTLCGISEKLRYLHNRSLCCHYLQNLRIRGYNEYVTPVNIAEIIPQNAEANRDTEDGAN